LRPLSVAAVPAIGKLFALPAPNDRGAIPDE
jgi:hypothetical protein